MCQLYSPFNLIIVSLIVDELRFFLNKYFSSFFVGVRTADTALAFFIWIHVGNAEFLFVSLLYKNIFKSEVLKAAKEAEC